MFFKSIYGTGDTGGCPPIPMKISRKDAKNAKVFFASSFLCDSAAWRETSIYRTV